MLSDAVTPWHYQRRIGHRHPVQVSLTWSPMQNRHWSHKATACTITTDNMSLTGIGFESPTCPDVGRGSPVKITIGQTVCTAAVRFARPGRTPGHSYYGVEVRDPQMIDMMQQLIVEYQRRHPGDERNLERPPVEPAPRRSLRF
ncbi:MAG TPA: PilZ domain-containing protein [Acidimicrobiales bacterium]|nr:PilZ domain-containing protein [Acidimicrobiales bacterium]